MKTIMRKHKSMFIAILAAMTLSFTAPVLAMEAQNTPPKAELKFIGSLKNNPVFQLDLNNAVSDHFVISIKDEYGTVLYSEKLKGVNISRKFRFDMNEVDEGKIRFEVASVSTGKSEIYEVDTYVRFVQEVVVNKIQ